MPKITPFLWFDNQAEEAMNFYLSIFKDSKVLSVNRYGDAGPGPKGSVMTANFELDGQVFTALNGGPTYPMQPFSPAISFVVHCETQAEVDHYWEKLSAGGKQNQCAWLEDKFGVTWQIVPNVLLGIDQRSRPGKSRTGDAGHAENNQNRHRHLKTSLRTILMKPLFATLLLLLAGRVNAIEWVDSPALATLFSEAGVHGTFVAYDVDADRLIGHDRLRAETRFIPASTFNIANSLIGLSVGAVSSVDEPLPYCGQAQMIKDWERDMGLREAIKLSNVPIYQALARRIGHERMREGVANLGYGNADIGDKVDRFWLDGPLQISAVEQTAFLARLARDQLPLSADVQAKVREIAMLEQSGERVLYGKTGWLNAPNPGIGWWVGWVSNGQHLYSFALNIDITQAADAPKRVELGKACLKALGIF